MDFEEDIYSSIFLALKHPVRRKVLRMLDESPATYTEILNGLRVETGFLNYHLESLGALIAKNEEGEYCLSEFGEAALALTTGVEAPIKRKSRNWRVFGFKINPVYISLVVMAVLVISNAYFAYAYQALSQGKTNALGEALIQTQGFLGESIHLLNITAAEGRIEFGLWDVLLRDLIQLSRQYKLIISLDADHRQQWSEIKWATDSLLDFVNDLVQTYCKGNEYMDITYEHSTRLSRIGDHLLNIKLKAFPGSIIIGSNPRVDIMDSEISEAMETSVQLQAELNLARRDFNLSEHS